MHDIKIHDVSFSYAGSDKLVLKDINVDVEGGESFVFLDNLVVERVLCCA